MKRFSIIKAFSSYLEYNDLAIFAGNNICKEAYMYDRPGNLYIEDETGVGISLAFGISMCTKKRVFIFCDDYYFLKELSSFIHIGISGCTNIFIIVLASGEYQHTGHNPTIFNELDTPKTIMFGAGFIINDYTKHFSNVHKSKDIKKVLETLYGSVFILIRVDLGENKKAGKVNLTNGERLKRLRSFLSVEGTSLYERKEISYTFAVEEGTNGIREYKIT